MFVVDYVVSCAGGGLGCVEVDVLLVYKFAYDAFKDSV